MWKCSMKSCAMAAVMKPQSLSGSFVTIASANRYFAFYRIQYPSPYGILLPGLSDTVLIDILLISEFYAMNIRFCIYPLYYTSSTYKLPFITSLR